MKHQYLKNVATLRLLPEKCSGCGRCVQVCPHGVFNIQDGKAVILDKDACMECGACAKNCPAKALDVNAGVGCASALIMSWLTGREPTCGCSGGGDCC